MNATELQALRRLLFFSAAEAARYVAADAQRPAGVEERTWNRWESGKVPVPANVAARVDELLNRRASMIREHLAYIESGTGNQVNGRLQLLWYSELEDWPHPPVLFRPSMSAIAHVLSVEPDRCELVEFDAIAYARWRRGLQGHQEDSPSQRAIWASLRPPQGFSGP